MTDLAVSPDEYKKRLAYPLGRKIEASMARINQWYDYWEGKVYVAYSGGLDSHVLKHLVNRMYPDVPAVFVNTGLEYPEIKAFVKRQSGVEWLRPKKTFPVVVKEYGYPIISKDQARAIDRYRNSTDPLYRHRRLNGWPGGKRGMISKKWLFLTNAPFKISARCCYWLKKEPLNRYVKATGRHPMQGMTAVESNFRLRNYLKRGCNAFNMKHPNSWPLAFWTRDDIWAYIRQTGISYCDIYDKGEDRTGCMFCMFGIQYDKEPNRFQRMLQSHPKEWEYCINRLGLGDVLDYLGYPYI